MLALRILANLFLLLHLRGCASFSTTTNNITYSNSIDKHWAWVPPRLLSTWLSKSSYFASQASKFSYTIPYGQTQECDIYGPLCQTGSITVTVNLTNVTTATVLPCSSYLTLQSYYLKATVGEGSGGFPRWTSDPWYTIFGRSPQCTSLAQAYSRGQITLSNCGNRDTVIKTELLSIMDDGEDPGDISSLQQPPGVYREFGMNYWGTCCSGNCIVDISEGRLYYFPDSTMTDCASNSTNNSTFLSARNPGKGVESIITNANIAVVSGNTFTSPSVYFQVLGTAGLRDECATVGPILTNPIVTFPPGALSTWGAFSGKEGVIAPLDVKDLACPTWGMGRSTASNGSVITTIGPPFLPLLVPNTQMLSLDPTWARLCTAINVYTYTYNQTFLIFDPPTALTPKAMMIPTSDTTPELTPRPNPADPTTMADPPVTASTNPARPVSGLVDPQTSPTKAGPLNKGGETTKPSPVQPKFPEPVFPFQSQRHPADLSPSPIGDPNKPSEASKAQPAGPLESTDPVFQQEDSHHSQTQGLGAIIYNALGKSGKEPGRDTGNVNTITLPNAGVQEVHVGGTQILSVYPSGVQVDGVAYSAGGPPLTFSGRVFTFVPQPNNNDRYNDRPSDPPSEPSNDPRPFSGPLSTVGQLITLNPSRMLVAGSTLLPGGPPITLSNTPLSLASSGILIYGSSSILLSPQSVFTIQSQPITANAAGFVINGESISPGGSAKTIDGTIISLGQSGQLAINNTLISLPTPESSPLVGPGIMIAGQTITLNPSEFTIAGTTIRAGGPAATVGGTIFSLQTSGTLIVGSTTIQLSALQTSLSSILSVDGLVSQGRSSSLAVIDGVTFTPGKADVPVAGSVVSLEDGGKTVDVGSARIAIPTGGAYGVGAMTVFKGGQERDSQIQVSMLSAVGVWAVWILLA